MPIRVLPCLFFAVLAVSYGLWLIEPPTSPLWADDLITIALVKSPAFKHMLSAVQQGLDATPPLYTSYGWFIFHKVLPETSPELLLRTTNAVLVAATIWVLYLLVREFFDQITALTTIGAFILLELWQLKFLTLEVRTYALFLFAATFATYICLRAIKRPSRVSWVWTALVYCLLVSSHTFGIIYVVCIAACAIAAALTKGNFRAAQNSGLAALPATVIFVLWLPVLHDQAQLGNWIPPPDVPRLLASTYLGTSYQAMLLVLAVLIALGSNRDNIAPLVQRRLSLSRSQIFVLLLPIAFLGSTFAVWLFSKFVFPVFRERYFYPNIALHTIWLSFLANWVLSYLKPSLTSYGLVLGCALLTGLNITYTPFVEDWWRVPCFDQSKNTYLEDPFQDGVPIVVLSSLAWLPRLNRAREEVLFPLDERALDENDAGRHWDAHFVRRFSEWLGLHVVTTGEMLGRGDFMVLDDGKGPWLKFIQRNYKLELKPLAEINHCRLWRVKVL
jgi:hypothetical protein